MKLDFRQIFNVSRNFILANKENIEIGVGIGLGVGATILSFRNGTKAEQLILKEKEYRVLESGIDPADCTSEQINAMTIPMKDMFKLTWPLLAGPTVMELGSCILIFLGLKGKSQASAAFAALAASKSSELKDMQDTVTKMIGDNKKKKEEFDKKKAETMVENHPPVEGKNVYGKESSDSPVLFYDAYTNEYFWLSLSDMVKAVAIYNSRVSSYFENCEDYNTFRTLTKRTGPCLSKFANYFGHTASHLMEIPDLERGENFEATIGTGIYAGHPALIFEEIGDGPILLREQYESEHHIGY